MQKNRFVCIICLSLIFFCITACFAYSYDDGFGSAKKIQSKHFSLHFAPQLSVTSLAQSLNIGFSDRLLVGKSAQRSVSLEKDLAEMLDTLFMQVSDILDIHIYSLNAGIKVCRDQQHLTRVYQALFGADLNNMRSFYVHDLKTIYISAGSFTAEILGHEMGHVIISHYFVVPPSFKIQEVLTGYVEFQLRKRKR